MVQAFPLFGQIQLFFEDFIAVKPDGVQRGLVGKIICRFEEKGFRLCAMKMTTASKDLLEMHFADLSSKPFFQNLLNLRSLGQVWQWFGKEKEQLKLIVKCLERLTLLILFLEQFVEIIVIDIGRNICHGSDSVETAKKEIALWFKEGELNNYCCANNY